MLRCRCGLRSQRYGLVGRPDQLVRVGRAFIPVEQQPRSRRVQPSHVLQVAAQCPSVQEVYGVRPPYGLLVLADGQPQRVEFSPSLERHLLETMDKIRELLRARFAPEPFWIGPKCRACGFREACWGPSTHGADGPRLSIEFDECSALTAVNPACHCVATGRHQRGTVTGTAGARGAKYPLTG